MQENSTEIALPLIPLRFHFDAPPELALPEYPGSAWRGAFGHALKKTVCVSRGVECEACLLYHSCAYPYLFKTPPRRGSAKMRRYDTVPVPYLLSIELQQSPNEYQAGLTLIGEACRHLAYVVHAMQLSGETGIGSSRQKLILREVRQLELKTGKWIGIYEPGEPLAPEPADCPLVPQCPAALDIHLQTPLRLKHDNRLVTPDTFRFRDLFSALLRRISMLTYFHGPAPLETDFAGLTAASEEIAIEKIDLGWHDWTRYSSRQKTTMQMGGIVGRIRLEGSRLEPFWPYLWIGQWVHAGKSVTMGLGRYRIETASLPSEPAKTK